MTGGGEEEVPVPPEDQGRETLSEATIDSLGALGPDPGALLQAPPGDRMGHRSGG